MSQKVLVLLAAYNGEDWLEEQTHSIFQQDDIETTLVVSIDQSSDNTKSLVCDLIHKYQNINKLNDSLAFGSAARNFFYLLTKVNFEHYDFVALSDQDDLWNPDKLDHALQIMLSHQVDAYSSNVVAFWPDGKKVLINKAQPQTNFDFMFESAGPGCTFVLSKELAKDLQTFLKNNFEKCNQIALHDWFIYSFSRLKGYKWFIDPKPSMLYRQHANNVIGANRGIWPMFGRLKKMTQGWYYQQILLIADILGYQQSWPIEYLTRLSYMDRLKLALHARQFRRRLRDQVAFAIYILLLAKK